MRTGQRNLYAERIARAVQELEELASRGEAPTLAALAKAAAMSDFHFHRIFRLMTGESVGEAMTRIRLGHSLSGLAPGADLREATGRSGYATSQAFSRALKDHIGATPGELRSDPEKRVNAASALSRSQPTPDAPLPALNIEIVSFDPLRLLAVRNIGDYAELNQGFGRLFEGICAQISPESIWDSMACRMMIHDLSPPKHVVSTVHSTLATPLRRVERLQSLCSRVAVTPGCITRGIMI